MSSAITAVKDFCDQLQKNEQILRKKLHSAIIHDQHYFNPEASA